MSGISCLQNTSWAQRGIVLLLAGVFGWTSLGIPLTGPVKQTNERFPCENCSCGCASADHCWQNCCCHTPAERLAWAEREGVAPPAYVVAQAKQAQQTQTLQSKPSKPACCCCKSGGQCAPEVSEEQVDATETIDAQVIAWRALECQGNRLNWLVATPIVVVTLNSVVSHPTHTTWLGAIVSETGTGATHQPPAPPPRFLLG